MRTSCWPKVTLRASFKWPLGGIADALDRGIARDASLIALELALVHLIQGRTPPPKDLALKALAVFAEQEVERRAPGGPGPPGYRSPA